MSSALLITGSVFVGIAGLIHVYIFVLESVQWSRPRTWRAFGIGSQADADTVKAMAFNQGFYNVFLAIGAGAGIVMLASANLGQGGAVLTFFSAGSMVLAALVLITSSPKLARAAAIQGLAPLIGIILIALGLAAAKG